MSKRPLVKGEGSVMANSPITSAKKSKSHISREAAKGTFSHPPLECCFFVLAECRPCRVIAARVLGGMGREIQAIGMPRASWRYRLRSSCVF